MIYETLDLMLIAKWTIPQEHNTYCRKILILEGIPFKLNLTDNPEHDEWHYFFTKSYRGDHILVFQEHKLPILRSAMSIYFDAELNTKLNKLLTMKEYYNNLSDNLDIVLDIQLLW